MIDVSVTIKGTPDVVIGTGTFELVGVTRGGRQWRRRTVEGPFMSGRALMGAVVETDTLVVEARIKAPTWTGVMNAYNTLVEAVSRISYQVVVTTRGHSQTVVCEPADVAAPVEKFRLHANMLEVTLSIPCDP